MSIASTERKGSSSSTYMGHCTRRSLWLLQHQSVELGAEAQQFSRVLTTSSGTTLNRSGRLPIHLCSYSGGNSQSTSCRKL